MNHAEIEEKVRSIISNELGLSDDEVKPGSLLAEDLGADSFDFLELVIAMEEEFGITIPDGDADTLRTVKDLCDYIASRTNATASLPS